MPKTTYKFLYQIAIIVTLLFFWMGILIIEPSYQTVSICMQKAEDRFSSLSSAAENRSSKCQIDRISESLHENYDSAAYAYICTDETKASYYLMSRSCNILYSEPREL